MTRDFGQLPENYWLLVLDVEALYPSIPHHHGKMATLRALNAHRTGEEMPTTASIVKLLDLVLTCNNFKFGDNHYLQKSGTAMGTRMAPSYANLFMADFEERYVYTYKNPPLFWKRFIDDIFSIFVGTEAQLKAFINHLNRVLKKHIHFTAEYSKVSVTFLDTVVYVEDGILKTSLHVKPTNSHSYLDYDSCHPRHNITGIPHSQFLRVRRICTEWHEFAKHSIHIMMHFSMRGYPLDLLTSSLERVNTRTRESVMVPPQPTTTEQKQLFFITTHNPTAPDMKRIINTHWPILGRSNATRALKDTEIIFGFRRPKESQRPIMFISPPP